MSEVCRRLIGPYFTVVLCASNAGAQIVNNGSFESGYTGWTSTGNQNVSTAGPYYTATSGSKLVAFNSGNTIPNGVLSQTIATVAGLTYTLAFEAGAFAYNTSPQILQVTVSGNGGAALLSQALTITGTGGGSNRWVPQSFTFIANSASTTLTFRDQSPTSDGIDLMLDNVRVTAPANTGLQAVNDAATIHPGQKVRVAVLANDSGPIVPGSLQIVAPPSTGTATIQPSGEILYAHAGTSTAPVSFTYRVSTAGGQSQDGSVTITISTSLRIPNDKITVPASPPTTAVQVVDAFPGVGLYGPTCIASPPGDSKRLFVCELNGRIRVIPDVTAANPVSSLVLDLNQAISSPARTPAESWIQGSGEESGLAGLVFHPNYASNGYIFVAFSVRKSNAPGVRFQRLSRFTISAAQRNQPAPVADPSSERILIDQRDRNDWHNGGDLHFGADGYLYYTVGDEGAPDDGYGNSQRIDMNFFGAMMRIDVDKKPGNLEPSAHPNPTANGLGFGPGNSIPRDEIPAGSGNFVARYSIPIDNPFVAASKGGAWDGKFNGVALPAANLPYVRSEFWAVGLRSPWRFSIDAPTGDIWLGDVGEGKYEEVDLITKGSNYGWGFYEGHHGGPRNPPAGFLQAPPIHEYAHTTVPGGDSSYKGNSVIGGLVYRGTRHSSLYGAYIFGDYVTGHIWSLTRPNGVTTVQRIAGQSSISAFGEDPSNGDILICNLQGGRIMRLTTTTNNTGFPTTLSATGLFADLSDLSPAPGVLPYSPNLPFWSDYAIKRRWFLIPNSTSKMAWSRDGAWTFPTGQIWIKHFDLETVRGDPNSPKKRIETRLLVKNNGGSYGVSYRWNEAGTEATLVGDAGVDIDVNLTVDGAPYTQRWSIPSRAECSTCHTPQAGHALSFNTRQLNLNDMIHGFAGNQIDLLQSHGYFSNTAQSSSILPRHAKPGDTDKSLEEKVRSYLAVNCSYCHAGADGIASVAWDGRAEKTLAQTGLINGASGVGGDYKLIAPGDTVHSVVLRRMIGTGGFSRMPPLGSNEIDSANISLVTNWINQMVPGVNTAPVAVADGYAAQSNTALVVSSATGVLANDTDPESDPLTASLQTGPANGTVTLNPNGGFTYTPATGYSGPDSFTYRTNDGSLNSNIATVGITVSLAPVVPPSVNILVNGSFESDYAGWVLTNNQGIQSAAPYAPTDGVKLASFNNTNSTPDGVLSQTFSTLAGQSYTLTFDAGALAYTTDSQTLQITVTGSGNLLTRTIVINGAGGGTNRWLPQSFSFVANSASTTLTFRDQSTATIAIDLLLDNVKVTGPPPLPAQNFAPVAVGENYSTRANKPLVISAPGVVGNDTDANLDLLTAVLDAGPANGSVNLNANGSFTYTPATDYTGPDSFTYHANDGALDSNVATVNITVTPIPPNTAPVSVADSYSTSADTPLVIPPAGVLANDTDAQSDTLTAVIDDGPAHGSITLNANGGFTYTPETGYTGPDSFTYHANDGSLNSNVSTASISVNEIVAVSLVNGSFESNFSGWTTTGNQSIQNSAPYASTDGVKLVSFNSGNSVPNAVLSQSFATSAGQTYTLAFDAGVLAFNSSSQTLQVTMTGSSPLLTRTVTVVGSGAGNNRWVPQSFSFVADGPLTTLAFRDQSSSTEALDMTLDNVRVTAGTSVPNTPPLAVADQYVVTQNAPLIVPPAGVLANDSDAESNPLTAVLKTNPANGTLTLNANGGFTYTPATGYSGPDSFTYQTNDGIALSNIATVTLTVAPPVSNSFVNGSFESDYSGWTWTGNQQVRTAGGGYLSSQGAKLVAFNIGNSAPNGVLSQTFATTPSQTYRLDFDIGALAFNTAPQVLRVTVNGSSSLLSQTVTINGPGNGSTLWSPRSFTFVANSASTTLAFRDQSATTDSIDLLLDNVRVAGISASARSVALKVVDAPIQQTPAPSILVAPEPPAPSVPTLTGTPGDLTISLPAILSGNYILEFSDDLLHWEKGEEKAVNQPGLIEFHDVTGPPVPPRRFYRIAGPQADSP